MRTVIDVPDEVIRSLDQVVANDKRSRAALIREAITEYLHRRAVPPAEAAFGLWQGQPREGVGFQSRLRDEWEGR